MLNTKVFLMKEDGSSLDISQQPGCCYLITADILGGKGIRVENYDDEEVKTFEKNEIPVI